MQRPPRSVREPLFGRALMSSSLLQGLVAWSVAVAVYGWALTTGFDDNTVRAQVFVAMVVGNITLVFSNRSLGSSWVGTWSRPNPSLWWLVLGGTVGLALVLNVPLLQGLFHFSAHAPYLVSISILTAGFILLLGTAAKRLSGAHG